MGIRSDLLLFQDVTVNQNLLEYLLEETKIEPISSTGRKKEKIVNDIISLCSCSTNKHTKPLAVPSVCVFGNLSYTQRQGHLLLPRNAV